MVNITYFIIHTEHAIVNINNLYQFQSDSFICTRVRAVSDKRQTDTFTDKLKENPNS